MAGTVINSSMEVHTVLGPGFLEAVYEEALLLELRARGVHVRRQVEIPIVYKGTALSSAFIDLLVEDELVVELKSIERFAALHTAQTVSYLKAGGFQLGLLINFNVPHLRLGIRRVIWSPRFVPITE
ncbi:MAG: GxxExxY protein [Kofleriaceae bacterium]